MTQQDDVRVADHRVQAEVRRLGFFAALDSITWHARSRVTEHLADITAASSRAAYVGWLRRVTSGWSVVPLPSGLSATEPWPIASLDPTCTGIRAMLVADLRDHLPATRSSLVAIPVTPADDVRCAAAAYTVTATAHTVAATAPAALELASGFDTPGAGTRYVRRCLEVDAVRNEVRHDLVAWAEQAGPIASDRMIRTSLALLETLGTALTTTRRRGW